MSNILLLKAQESPLLVEMMVAEAKKVINTHRLVVDEHFIPSIINAPQLMQMYLEIKPYDGMLVLGSVFKPDRDVGYENIYQLAIAELYEFSSYHGFPVGIGACLINKSTRDEDVINFVKDTTTNLCASIALLQNLVAVNDVYAPHSSTHH